MGPPGERSRAHPHGPDPDATSPTASTIDQAGDEWTRHGSPFCRYRHFDMNRRRREQAELKRRRPAHGDSPSTFGLSDGELRSHANRLVLEHGWTVAEVVQVLDVEPAS